MFRRKATLEWGEHPYAVRTWVRSRLPYWMVNLGLSAKKKDCSEIGAEHHWYNKGNESSACYHCSEVRLGRLWEQPRVDA